MINNINYQHMTSNIKEIIHNQDEDKIQILLNPDIRITEKVDIVAELTNNSIIEFPSLLTLFEDIIKFSNNKTTDFKQLAIIFIHFMAMKSKSEVQIDESLLNNFINENAESINNISQSNYDKDISQSNLIHYSNNKLNYFNVPTLLKPIITKLLINGNIFIMSKKELDLNNMDYSNRYLMSILFLKYINSLDLKFISEKKSELLNMLKIYESKVASINNINKKEIYFQELSEEIILISKFKINTVKDKPIKNRIQAKKYKEFLLHIISSNNNDAIKNIIRCILSYPKEIFMKGIDKDILQMIQVCFNFPEIYQQIVVASRSRFFEICNFEEFKYWLSNNFRDKKLALAISEYLLKNNVKKSVFCEYENIFYKLDAFKKDDNCPVIELQAIIASRYPKVINKEIKNQILGYLENFIQQSKDLEVLKNIKKYLTARSKPEKNWRKLFLISKHYDVIISMLEVIKYNRYLNVRLNNSTKILLNKIHDKIIENLSSFHEFISYVCLNFPLTNKINSKFFNQYKSFKAKLASHIKTDLFQYRNLDLLIKGVIAIRNKSISLKLKKNLLRYIKGLYNTFLNQDKKILFKRNIKTYLSEKSRDKLDNEFLEEFGYMIYILDIMLYHRILDYGKLTKTSDNLLKWCEKL